MKVVAYSGVIAVSLEADVGCCRWLPYKKCIGIAPAARAKGITEFT